jgi:hypothetical protein
VQAATWLQSRALLSILASGLSVWQPTLVLSQDTVNPLVLQGGLGDFGSDLHLYPPPQGPHSLEALPFGLHIPVLTLPPAFTENVIQL